MDINSAKTHYKVRPGIRRHHKESKERARNQNGKTGKKQEAEDFSSIKNYKMKMVLEEKEKKTKIILKLIVNVYMITILVSKSLETIGIASMQLCR
jgi:hypothetical protein